MHNTDLMFQILTFTCDACRKVILRVPSQLDAEKFVGRGKKLLKCVINLIWYGLVKLV